MDRSLEVTKQIPSSWNRQLMLTHICKGAGRGDKAAFCDLILWYQELSAPVANLQTIDSESRALSRFLAGLETNQEYQR